MKNHYPRVSIIIANFNGKKYLKRLFNSIARLDYPRDKIETIFVDNVSADGSIEFMQRRNYPGVRIIRNDVNNYCKAINRGIEASSAQFVALVNTDIRLDKHWLAELVKVITQDDMIAAAGSKLLDMNGKIQNAAHYELPNFYWGERGAGQGKEWYDTLEEVSSLCGAAVLYREAVF
jgi:GT2 family glycosyltransferase